MGLVSAWSFGEADPGRFVLRLGSSSCLRQAAGSLGEGRFGGDYPSASFRTVQAPVVAAQMISDGWRGPTCSRGRAASMTETAMALSDGAAVYI